MSRRRRSADEARTEILDAAEELLVSEGPSGVRIRAVADAVGLSHPGVLHHFGSVDQLLGALHRRAARRVREEILATLPTESSPEAVSTAIAAAFERLSDPREGRILAWLVASGRDPFPPAEEHGLDIIAQGLHARRGGGELDETRYLVMLGVLAMYGDALVGSGVRRRLGLDERDGPGFRTWLLELLTRELQRE
jgi:AcrR family transcriptional regulator